jgi:LysM repeat protein
LNAPLIPAPGLSSPGATTMGSSLVMPMTPAATMNSGETTTGGLLPPMTGSGGSMGSGVGNGHTGTSSGHGTIDLTNPRHSTIDLTPATPGGFGEPSPMGVTPAEGSGTYTIMKGDTFGSLAKKNGVTIKAIQAANPGVNSSHLKIGQKIKMPSASSASSSGSSATSRPASSNRTATTKKSSKGSTTKPSGEKAVAGGTYTVKKGDTLRKIAKAVYGDESLWQRIFRANRGEMSDANDLTIGQVIKLPATK